MDTNPPTVFIAELEAITPQSKPQNELSAADSATITTAKPKVAVIIDHCEKEVWGDFFFSELNPDFADKKKIESQETDGVIVFSVAFLESQRS